MSILDALLGTWAGGGHGIYPTIAEFDYLERVTFTRSPKGFIVYQQTTSHPVTGAPMHAEVGYLRAPNDVDQLELVLVQPTGVTEVHSGAAVVDGGVLKVSFRSSNVSRTLTAKRVDEVIRNLTVTSDHLQYEMHMASVGQPLQLHLTGFLHREP